MVFRGKPLLSRNPSPKVVLRLTMPLVSRERPRMTNRRPREVVDLSPIVADEVNTHCYMCACRCGIKVH